MRETCRLDTELYIRSVFRAPILRCCPQLRASARAGAMLVADLAASSAAASVADRVLRQTDRYVGASSALMPYRVLASELILWSK